MTQEQLDRIYYANEAFTRDSSLETARAHDAACEAIANEVSIDVLSARFQDFKERPSSLNYRRLIAMLDVWQYKHHR